jgi:hypothetical protein
LQDKKRYREKWRKNLNKRWPFFAFFVSGKKRSRAPHIIPIISRPNVLNAAFSEKNHWLEINASPTKEEKEKRGNRQPDQEQPDKPEKRYRRLNGEGLDAAPTKLALIPGFGFKPPVRPPTKPFWRFLGEELWSYVHSQQRLNRPSLLTNPSERLKQSDFSSIEMVV